jgi:hypothetical protein
MKLWCVVGGYVFWDDMATGNSGNDAGLVTALGSGRCAGAVVGVGG